ncbi:hypothetical protein ACC691_41725, partial [Rhizobium johnstonii]|uniref:hypothetical protein n=1 Tax=Rhizobium johnstonii TaxID=3019933 RepID=UPI003F96F82B
DKYGDEVPLHLLRRSLAQNEELRAAFSRAWPVLDPAGVVGDLLSVPSYLRRCAPWLDDEAIAVLQRNDARAWTVS